MPNYDHYNADEFIQDPLFMEWIYENTPASVAYWHDWISRRPSNLEEFLEAEQALRMLKAIFGREMEVEDPECISESKADSF